jgi:hypothetical protein
MHKARERVCVFWGAGVFALQIISAEIQTNRKFQNPGPLLSL